MSPGRRIGRRRGRVARYADQSTRIDTASFEGNEKSFVTVSSSPMGQQEEGELQFASE
jgi:hypothetical protein